MPDAAPPPPGAAWPPAPGPANPVGPFRPAPGPPPAPPPDLLAEPRPEVPLPRPEKGLPRIALLAGVALCAVIDLWNSWQRDFWPPDEPRFAAVTREAGERLRKGDLAALLDPTIGGEPYAEKGPLLYWCALLSSAITGGDPRWAYRLPVAGAAGLALLVTYLAGRRFASSRVAALAVLIQASSLLHFYSGSRLSTDMLFAVTASLALVSFGIALLWELGSLRWTLTGWVALGLAGLAENAVLAPLLVLGPLCIFVLTKRGGPGILRELSSLKPLWGAAIFLGLVAPWQAVAAFRHGGEFLRQHYLGQHLAALTGSAGDSQPFWHYLATLPLGFLPWSVFLPLTVFYGKTRFRRIGPRFFAVWAVGMFLVLSMLAEKRGARLLVLWPALSLLLADALLPEERESIWESFLGEKVFLGLGWALRVPLALALAWAAFWALGLHARLDVTGDAAEVLAREGLLGRGTLLSLLAGGALCAAGVGVVRSLRVEDNLSAAACLGAGVLLVQLLFTFGYAELNHFRSPRALSEEVASAVGDRELAAYGRARAAVHYYLGRPVARLEELDPLRPGSEAERRLDAYLEQPSAAFLLIAEQDLERLRAEHPKYRERLHVVRQKLRAGDGRWVVLASN